MADELVIGTIVEVAEHPGARAPSLLLTVDLGTHGIHDAVLPTGGTDELKGTQVLCRRSVDGVAIVGAHSHGSGFVLLSPNGDVESGTLVD